MKRLNITALLVLSLPFLACQDNLPVSSHLRGDIWGDIELYDKEGVRMNDRSGALVSLEGTSFSTRSNEAGEWRLKNVPAGVYTIVFEKEGFTWAKEQMQFVGNGVYYMGSHTLAGIPTYTILDLSVAVVEEYSTIQIKLAGRMSDAPGQGITRYAWIYFSADSTSFETTYKRYGGNLAAFGSDVMSGYIDRPKLYDEGFPAGSVVYLKAYPATAAPYFSPSYGIRPVPDKCLGCSDDGSPVVRLVMP